MMTRTPKKLVARALVAGIAFSAVGLLVAAPALADTDDLYTYLYFDGGAGFATMDPTTGVVTGLPTGASDPAGASGAEVFDGVGTAVSQVYIDATESDEFAVYGWDVTSGAESAPVALTLAGAEVVEVTGLDTLADGTVITSIEYFSNDDSHHTAIASIDRTTGTLTVIVDTTALGDVDGFHVNSIGTDPISGGTYVFLEQVESSSSYYSLLNLVDGTYGVPTLFAGTGFGSGFFEGADFDAAGTLYFIYGNDLREVYELSTLGAPATWPTAARVYVADAASNYPDQYPLDTLALTLGWQVSPPAPAPAPVLAATGSSISVPLLAGGGIALLGGLAAVVITRRRRVG